MSNKAFILVCRTGSTCCASENHIRGIYKTNDEAVARARRFLQGVDNPVASLFARHGSYTIRAVNLEFLPDGRIIVNSTHVFSSAYLVKVNIMDGSLEDAEDDFLSANEYTF